MKDFVENAARAEIENLTTPADIVPDNTENAVPEQIDCELGRDRGTAVDRDEWEELLNNPPPSDEGATDAQLLAVPNSIGANDAADETDPACSIQVEETVSSHLSLVRPASVSTGTEKPADFSQQVPFSPQLKDAFLPDGYAVFQDGVYELPTDENADPVFICTPLRVDAIFSNDQGRGWGRLISVKSTNDQWHDIPITNADLQLRPGEVLGTLVDHGLEMAADKKTRDRLLTLLKTWKPDQHLQTVKRMGWIDDQFGSFVLGGDLVGRADVLPLAPTTGIAIGLASSGHLDDWKAHVGEKCRDNPLMVLAVSLAFSGPLLSPLGLSGGGLHFRGASSSGKTTLLHLAASVWGGRQLITQWRATSNGLEAIAATMNDMLLPLDEIAEISASNLHEAIYMLANGTGKARMTKDVALADQARWRLALISSGEISVEEKLKEARLKTMAGHEVRLIDIEADSRLYGAFDALHGAASASAFAESMQQAARVQHGAVGRAFVQMLIDHGEISESASLDGQISVLVSNWLAKLPSAPDGQISRVAKRFALIGVAGNIATTFGLTGWGDQEALAAAEQAFLDWYDRRYSAKRDALDCCVKSLQKFLTVSLSALPEIGKQHVVGAKSFGWRDASRVYLPSDTWAILFPASEGARAAKALLDMQMLVPGEDGRYMRKAPRTIPGRPRLYTLNTERVQTYRSE